MGLPIGKDMDGRVLEELIDPEFLSAHPIQYIDSYEKQGKHPSVAMPTPVADRGLLNYLRSLGYIE